MIQGSFIATVHVSVGRVIALKATGPFTNPPQQFQFCFRVAQFIFGPAMHCPTLSRYIMVPSSPAIAIRKKHSAHKFTTPTTDLQLEFF